MPAPAAAAAITVAAIASAVALGFVFTKTLIAANSDLSRSSQFVYEPHLAPKLEQWAEEFLATREARRRQRAGAVPVLATPHVHDRHDLNDFDSNAGGERQPIPLENLGSRDVREWRSEVDRSQTLRRRRGLGSSGSRYSLEASGIRCCSDK
ncbi:hypothetical protein C0992_013178 [Termitomyces sp. T32_za158]|nr:hypothetical protein C0992_013178 [Termitomyces sp. T32_za158]